MKVNELLLKKYYSELKCRIIFLGCSKEGEAIIFVVYGDGMPIFSCITDSFVLEDRVIIDEELKKIGIDEVDALFWTHPHDDHSNGIIELIEHHKPKYILMPEELLSLPERTHTVSKNVLHTINRYKTLDNRCRDLPVIDTVSTNKILVKDKIMVANNKIDFKIIGVAPYSPLVRKMSVGDFNKLNNYSIVIAIEIGDFSILLTGDVQDEMIKYVSREILCEIHRPNILKIPHHGSKYSLLINQIFESDTDETNINISVSTCKVQSKLPKEESLNHYKSFSDNLFYVNPDSKDVAVWDSEINILKGTIKNLRSENFLKYSSI